MTFKPFAPPSDAEPTAADFSPAADPAERILRDASMSDAARATAWDQFHSSKDHTELAQRIQHVEMDNDTRRRLSDAKKATAPTVSPVEKVRAAIESVSKMDSAMVEIAEKNPTVLKALVDTVMPKAKS